MRTLFCLLLAIGANLHAKEAVIEGGRSKDGRFEVRIIEDTSGDPSGYTFAIVNIRSGKRIGELSDVGAYHSYDQARQDVRALWNDNGSFVAITDSDSRHTERLYIIHVSSDSTSALQIPDFVQNALGRVDATEIDLHSHPNLDRWEGNRLCIALHFAVAHPTRYRIHYQCGVVLECADLDSIARLRSITKPEDIESP